VTRELLSGNHAQARAVRLARAQVVAAYPITPQTTIVEALAEDFAAGRLAGRYIPVESEHSALQTCLSASALGARTYTATSSQGLLLMHELLHWASGLRAPIVMGVVDRAVAPPWSIGADHTDAISQRDTGWIQFFAESNQEVLDTVLVAYRVAEDIGIRLPAMIAEDAFFLSHTYEPVDVPEPDVVDRFLPARGPTGTLAVDRPERLGSFTGPVEWVEFRRAVAKAMEAVPAVLAAAEADYGRATGRPPEGPVALYRTDDAEAVLVTVGTISTTARAIVDELRASGKRVGLAKLRMFRPFPAEAFRALAASVDRIGVVDRAYTFGGRGPVAGEVAAALYGSDGRPRLESYLAGIGGRDVGPAEIRRMFALLLSDAAGPSARWIDLEPAEEVATHG